MATKTSKGTKGLRNPAVSVSIVWSKHVCWYLVLCKKCNCSLRSCVLLYIDCVVYQVDQVNLCQLLTVAMYIGLQPFAPKRYLSTVKFIKQPNFLNLIYLYVIVCIPFSFEFGLSTKQCQAFTYNDLALLWIYFISWSGVGYCCQLVCLLVFVYPLGWQA